MNSESKRRVAEALLKAAEALTAASSTHLIFEDDDETAALFEQAHDLFSSQGIYLHNGYDRFFVLVDDADDERVIATAAMCLYDTDEPPSIEFSVAVAPGQQRKGLGKKLIEEVVRYTKQQATEFDWGDDTEVEAYVVNDAAMVPLLRGLGFEPSASDPKRWRRKAEGALGTPVSASAEELFHGSNQLFNEFSKEKIGKSQRGPGVFFSNSEKYAKVFGPYVYRCIVSLKNPKVYPTSMDFQVDVLRSGDDVTALYDSLKADGHDGVVIKKSKVSTGVVREVIAFDPSSATILVVERQA